MGSIAIVGCGAAGTALIVHLAERQWEGIDRILIIDPRLPASGIAFDRDEEYLLCNTSVGVNSLIPREPDHLRKWLMRNPVCTARWGVPSTDITEHSYLPRGLFLAYLAEHFRSALAHAQSRGVYVDHVPASARAIESTISGVDVVTDRGETYPVDEAVICTGLHPSAQTLRRQKMAHGRLWGAYETPRHVAELDRAKRVLVLGMRQSAIDAAQMVHEFNPDAEVTMASRTGRLPAVRTEMKESHSTVITTATVIDRLGPGLPGGVMRWRHLLKEQLRLHDPLGSLFPTRGTTASEQLRNDLDHARSTRPAWQRIDRNAVTVANAAWPHTPPEQRRELAIWFNRFILRYVSAIPDSVADRLIASEEQQRLSYVRAGDALTFDHSSVRLASENGPLTFDVAIDATGLSAEPGNIRSSESRPPDPRIHRIGPAAVGQLAIPNYFNASARQAASLADDLTRQPISTCTGTMT